MITTRTWTGLVMTLVGIALVGCGSTSEARQSEGSGTPAAHAGPDPAAQAPPTANATGTTDKGSRYLEFSDPIGAVPVESDPLGNETAWSPPASPPPAQPDVLGRPPPHAHKVPPLPPLEDDE